MRRLQILTIILIVISSSASGQIFRYRLTANSGMIFKETGQSEIINPNPIISEYPSATDFSPTLTLGADFEIMAPITSNFEAGLEFEYNNLAGRTETSRLYNFWLYDWVNPLPDEFIYPADPIVYETTHLSILGTTRFYFLPPREPLNIFLKAFGGIAFIGTDLKFAEAVNNVNYDVGVLYARGTKNSQKPKEKAFQGGLGIGGQYALSSTIAVYLEANGSFVNSGHVNGVPDFNYTEEAGRQYEPAEGIGTLMGQISIGLIYSAIGDSRLNRGNYTKSRRVTKKKTWKKKRANPFKRKRRRR